MAAAPPIVDLYGVSKSYGGVHALSDVSFAIEAATVHALVGENGAGKSTLVKILTGVVHPDAGDVLIDGSAQRIASPQVAQRLGIVAMYQEPTVFPDLTVAENVFAGRQPRTRYRVVDWQRMRSIVAELLDELDVDFGPESPVRGLGVADRQLLEIAKALSSNARLLIMDEPTAALSPKEVENLFQTVRRLRDRGVAIVFISHRLDEVAELSDSVTVLRDGRHVATQPMGDLSQPELVRLMVGSFPRGALPEGGGSYRRGRPARRGVVAPGDVRRRQLRAPSR